MDLEQNFLSLSAAVQQLSKRPANDELLTLYSLFKQATEGDASGDRPGGFDFKAIAKFDAWTEKKGMSKEAAMTEYIQFATDLIAKYS